MSTVSLGTIHPRVIAQRRAVQLLHARRRQLMRLHPDPLMGSMLSDWIKKRKAQGININTGVGKGSLSFSLPGEQSPGAPGAPGGGPLDFVKRNPVILAGIAGGGLLVLLLVLKKRKKG